MTRWTWLSVVLLTAFASSACSPPQRPLELTFKEVPSNVVLGAQSTPGPVSTVPSLLVLPPPVSVVAFPPPAFAPPRTRLPARDPLPVSVPAPPACPTADPLRAPQREAPAQVSVPPARATYLFRNNGRYRVSGADARSGSFPPISIRTVGKATGSPSDFSYDVSELLGEVTTVTTYEVVTASLVPAALAPGLYLKGATSTTGGAKATFAPSPPLLLAGFPLVRGAAVTSTGVDPQTATTMRFTSTVTGKGRVDACGTPLDAWVLDLSAGTLLSPTENLSFTARYAVGTQYGGLLLQDSAGYSGTEGSDGVARTDEATISTVPKLP